MTSNISIVFVQDLKHLLLISANNSYLKDFCNRIEKYRTELPINSYAPEILLPDVNGNMISLSSLRGKTVLIDFWASWCSPCREEIISVIRSLYNEYKSQKFEILGVSFDDKVSNWKDAIKKDGNIWLNIADTKGLTLSSTAKSYSVGALPSNILVNAEGKIIAKNKHGDELLDLIKELLDNSKQ